MPSYRAHLTAGSLLFVLLYVAQTKFSIAPLSFQETRAALISILIGSIFPDIDTTSVMQRLFFLCILIIAPILIFQGNHTLLFAAAGTCVAILLLPHRSITHKPSWVIPASCLGCAALVLSNNINGTLAWLCWTYFVVGFLSHWFLDRYV